MVPCSRGTPFPPIECTSPAACLPASQNNLSPLRDSNVFKLLLPLSHRTHESRCSPRKRGLPHAHILTILDGEHTSSPDDYDLYVSALARS